MATMSDTVRRAIRQCGLTQYQIAKQTDISEGGLSRFMRGQRDLTLGKLEQIADVIGVQLVIDPKKRRRKGR